MAGRVLTAELFGEPEHASAPTSAPKGRVLTTELFPELAPQPRSFTEELGRQAGLTARYGVEGLANVAGIFTNPIAATANLFLPKSSKLATLGASTSNLLDNIGLPKPENATERIVGDMSRLVAGAGGLSSAARATVPLVGGGAKLVAKALASNPGTQAISAAGAGLGTSTAREIGYGPGVQFAAGLGGAVLAPGAASLAGGLKGHAVDATSVARASFGHQKSIDKLAGDAARRVAGDSREKILADIKNVEEYIPGSPKTVAEAIAQNQIGKAGQHGGATIKLQQDLTGADGIADVLTGVARTRNVAIENHLKALNTKFGPARERILAEVNARGGVRPSQITKDIDKMMARTDLSEFGYKSLEAIRSNIVAKIGKHNNPGRIDADAIYTTRKELGDIIARVSKDNQTWDKRVTGKMVDEIQDSIDRAIKQSGGTGWREQYMNPYSAGRRAVDNTMARLDEAELIGKSVKGSNAKDLTAGELPSFPTLLNRNMMMINFGLRLISRDANTPVAKELAKRLQDPKGYAELLALPAKHPLRTQAEAMLQTAAILGAQQENQ